jgi:hypothetical protein
VVPTVASALSAPTSAATVAPAGTKPAAAPTAGVATKALPELEGLQWFNSAPLKLSELRGKPVLMVFWSTI